MIATVLSLCMSIQTPSVLVVDGVVLGCRTESTWTRFQTKTMPSSYGFTEVKVGELGTATSTASIGLNQAQTAPISQTPMPNGVFFSGFSMFPRPVYENRRDRMSYLPLLTKFAQNRGIAAPKPYILHVWRADLDGSGKLEDIVEAVSRPAVLRGEVQEGDWSVVLLRWNENGQERLYPLALSFPKAGERLERAQLRAIADLDGDGMMEAVTTNRFSKGMSATLWQLSAGKLYPLADVSLTESL